MPFLRLMNMLKPIVVIICCLNILQVSKVEAQGFLKANGKKIVNEKGENILLRGMGLGGWMLQEGYMLGINEEGQQHRIRERVTDLIGGQKTSKFYDLWLAGHTRKIDIDSMKAWGFNSVRLPMHYNLYTLSIEKEPVKGKNTWLDKGFAMTDSLLAWCKENNMYLILDLHAAPGGQGNDLNISDRNPSNPSLWESEANKEKTIALWRKLAERYSDESWIGAYDIINEPNWGFEDQKNDKNGIHEKKNVPLKKLMVDITKAIREVDKKHIVIIEGNGWGNNYNGILPPWDDNMVLSFHKYWSYNDQKSAEQMIKTRDQYNIPIWLGETGENSNVWFTEAIRLFENNNIGWAWWPLKKLGNNNPIQIKTNKQYAEILSYWNGNGRKPKERDAFQGLMQLVNDVKLENAIVHRDVIDAMIRQPFSSETKPFKSNLVTADGDQIIKAVDYDFGRNGMAYFDKDTADYHISTGKRGTGNRGGMYRNDGVDIRLDTPFSSNYYVSNIENDEWLQYTIDVAEKGSYTLKLSVASKDTSGKISITSNGVSLVNSLPIPDTGSLTSFKNVEIKNIPLNSGKQQIRIHADTGGFNFSSLQFSK